MAGANPRDEGGDLDEPPSKRIKLSSAQPSSNNNNNNNTSVDQDPEKKMDEEKPDVSNGGIGFQPEREAEVGILHFVNSTNPGFSGILKQRYTDFLVNEIAPDGTVVHLTDDKAPKINAVSKTASNTGPTKVAPDAQENDYSEAEIKEDALAFPAVAGAKEEEKLNVEVHDDPPTPHDVSNAKENKVPNVQAEEVKVEDEAPSYVSRFATRDVRLEDPNFVASISKSSTVPEPSRIAPYQGSRAVIRDIRLEDPSFAIEAKKTAGDAMRAGLLPTNIVPTSASKAKANVEKASFVVAPEDEALLTSYFGSNIKDQIIKFHAEILAKPDKKPSLFGSLMSDPITNRELRTKLHRDVRRIFESRIETESLKEPDGVIKIFAAGKTRPREVSKPRPEPENKPRGKVGWQEFGGEYLHFSLYKENKDTMEVIGFLARKFHTKPQNFAFSGTKDRRAVTVQRVSVLRQKAERLAMMNRQLRGSTIGNFKYEKHGLELGELQGNQFHITLRDCHFGDDTLLDTASRLDLGNKVVGEAVKHLEEHGFLNYYGLQRFGTFGIGTDEVGKLLLKGDFESAVKAILNVSDKSIAVAKNPEAYDNSRINKDDIARAQAIQLFKDGASSHEVLEKLPRKFNAESAIIRHLASKNKREDYIGALNTIPRNLKLMYVHAYQSLVWNTTVSERWARHGNRVIKGDLVLIDGQSARNAATREDIDENGEVIVHPDRDDSAIYSDDIYQRARALTAEEAESGQYSIFDIVLPTPGYDIEYPDNDIGDFYKEFMGSERGGGLDPADMRRKQKDFSLSGSYRKLIARVGADLSFELKTYHAADEQLVETDLEKLFKSTGREYKLVRNQDDRRQDNGSRNERGARGGRQQNGQSNRGGRRGDVSSQQQVTQIQTQHLNTAQHAAWNALPAKLAAEDAEMAEAVAAERLIPKKPEDIIIPTIKDTYIQTAVENGETLRTGHRSTIVHQGTAASSNDEFKTITNTQPPQYDGSFESKETEAEAPTIDTHPTDENGASDEALVTQTSVSESVPIAVDEAGKGAPDSVNEKVDVNMANTVLAVERNEEPAKIAVIVKFSLGSSTYATMALRELMKAGGVKTYKPDFSGGR